MADKQHAFLRNQSLHDFQEFIGSIYRLPDDRHYSLFDLLIQQQRFTMCALKGIRKNDTEKIKINLIIALSWSMSVANRLHLNIQKEVWMRFPNMCPYCQACPCVCKADKQAPRMKASSKKQLSVSSLADMQTMFAHIYPADKRSLADAGVHLAEEMGEISEAIHNFLGRHQKQLFRHICLEMADYISCLLGVANSARIDLAHELEKTFYNNCHICHKAPCICGFSTITNLKT